MCIRDSAYALERGVAGLVDAGLDREHAGGLDLYHLHEAPLDLARDLQLALFDDFNALDHRGVRQAKYLRQRDAHGRIAVVRGHAARHDDVAAEVLSLIHISEPTRLGMISYAVFCL